MPKMKVPRKSTSIDMTAMCDVAFLLLSFFIFTAKFKKPQEIEITAPNSVATDSVSVKNKFNIYVEIAKDGRVLMGFENDSITRIIANEVNTQKALGLTPDEIGKFANKTAIGDDFTTLKSYLSSLGTPEALKEPRGIPVLDSTNNQLPDWIRITDGVYQKFKARAYENDAELAKQDGYSRTIYVKGDKEAPYKVVDKVMEIFAKNNIDQFKLVTVPLDAPVGTALYETRKKEKTK